jgi:hypothetical protein
MAFMIPLLSSVGTAVSSAASAVGSAASAVGSAAGSALGISGSSVGAGVGLTGTGSGLSLGQGLMMGGSLISGFSQAMQGQAQKQAYNANAKTALENMRAEEQKSFDHYRRIKSQQRTLYGEAGVDISSGSPLLVLADTASMEKQNQQDIKESGETQASYDRFYGEQAGSSGMFGGFTTFITGLGKAKLIG